MLLNLTHQAFNLCFKASKCVCKRQMRPQKSPTKIGHTCEHTQTALCGRRPRDGGPPLPVLTIQPLNLAFMNGNTFRSLDGNLFQSKFDKGHSHVDSQASSQVFTRHVVIAFATPNILNINSRELVLGKRGKKKKNSIGFFFFWLLYK